MKMNIIHVLRGLGNLPMCTYRDSYCNTSSCATKLAYLRHKQNYVLSSSSGYFQHSLLFQQKANTCTTLTTTWHIEICTFTAVQGGYSRCRERYCYISFSFPPLSPRLSKKYLLSFFSCIFIFHFPTHCPRLELPFFCKLKQRNHILTTCLRSPKGRRGSPAFLSYLFYGGPSLSTSKLHHQELWHMLID